MPRAARPVSSADRPGFDSGFGDSSSDAYVPASVFQPIARIASGVFAACLASLAVPTSRADDVDRAIGSVIRLDQRVHIMALEFNETPSEAPDLPDRRVVDAQGLIGLGRYDEATALLLNVMVRWPRSPAAHDASILLGDALFQVQDFVSARRSYEKAVSTFTGTKREQQALVRLLEIALRAGDFARSRRGPKRTRLRARRSVSRTAGSGGGFGARSGRGIRHGEGLLPS
jgi:hypothetical protein